MKRFMKGIAVLISLLLLCSCSERLGDTGSHSESKLFKLSAKVNSLGEKIEVDVVEGEYASGIYWVIISDDAVITDKDGNITDRKAIKVGDTVEIEYNGQIMMSLPPQIVARRMKIK